MVCLSISVSGLISQFKNFLENYTDIGQLMTGREYNVIEIEVIQSFVYKFRSLITDQNSYTTK